MKKQCGDNIIEITDTEVISYEITKYRNYEPIEWHEEKRVKFTSPPQTWTQATDLIFGAPTMPDFTKALRH